MYLECGGNLKAIDLFQEIAAETGSKLLQSKEAAESGAQLPMR